MMISVLASTIGHYMTLSAYGVSLVSLLLQSSGNSQLAELTIYAEPNTVFFVRRTDPEPSIGFWFFQIGAERSNARVLKMGIISNSTIKKVMFSMEITKCLSIDRPLAAMKIW